MKLVLAWSRLIEDFVAGPRLVVLLFALLTEHMPDVVAVLSLKFI
jgi:hypothetical protein